MKNRFLLAVAALLTAAPAQAAVVKLSVMAGQSNLIGGWPVPYSPQYADSLIKLYPDLTIWIDQSADMRDDEYPAGNNVAVPRFAQSIDRTPQNLGPVTHSARGLGGTMTGPEVQFGRLLQARYGVAQKIALVKFAIGGSSLNRHWLEPRKVNFSDQLLIALAQIKQQIEEAGDTVQFEGFAWIQGTGDAELEADAAKYLVNLRALRSKVRGFVGNPKLPFVIEHTSIDLTKLSPRAAARMAGPLAIVNKAQRDFVAEDKCAALVHMERFPHGDAVHYDPAAYYAIGQAFYVGHAQILQRAECR